MTVDTTGGAGTDLATWTDDDIGLEDASDSDIVLPRLTIVHADGVFKDNLSGNVFPYLDVILLGQIKQRVMWESDVEDGDRPQCKSPDHVHGFPNIDPNARAETKFPWDQSNFDPSMLLPVVEPASKTFPEGWNSNGHGVLPCDSCVFSQWGKSPSGKSTPPPCSEQHTYPLMYTPDGGQTWVTALLSLQRTGIKPSRTYTSSFIQTRSPLFSVMTRITLNQLSRGTVKYCVPTLQKGEPTDRSLWLDYANTYRGIRSFLRAAPRGDEEEVVAASPTDNAWNADAAGSAPVAPAAPAAPVQVVQPAAPPAPPAPVAPVAVATAPVAVAPAPPAPPAPVAPAAPVAAPAPVANDTPAPPSTPAMASPAVAVEDDDDVPF